MSDTKCNDHRPLAQTPQGEFLAGTLSKASQPTELGSIRVMLAMLAINEWVKVNNIKTTKFTVTGGDGTG